LLKKIELGRIENSQLYKEFPIPWICIHQFALEPITMTLYFYKAYEQWITAEKGKVAIHQQESTKRQAGRVNAKQTSITTLCLASPIDY